MLATILPSFFVALVEGEPNREEIIPREPGEKTLLRGRIGSASLRNIRCNGFLHGLILFLAPHELGLVDRCLRPGRGAAEGTCQKGNNDGATHRPNETQDLRLRTSCVVHGIAWSA